MNCRVIYLLTDLITTWFNITGKNYYPDRAQGQQFWLKKFSSYHLSLTFAT